jgi:hypothetical protein
MFECTNRNYRVVPGSRSMLDPVLDANIVTVTSAGPQVLGLGGAERQANDTADPVCFHEPAQQTTPSTADVEHGPRAHRVTLHREIIEFTLLRPL